MASMAASQLAAAELLPAAAANDMGVVAAPVLAGGLFTDGPKQVGLLERVAQEEGAEERQRLDAVLERLSAETGSLPQQAFRYVLGDERVSTVSSGAASVSQLEEVARAPEMGRLERFSPDLESG